MAKQTDIRQIVRKFHERLEKVLCAQMQVILYGSHARGEAKEDSDIDVLVIVPKLDPQTDATISDVAWEVSFESGVVLSVVPVSQDELPLLKASQFFQTVQREGIKL